MSPMSVIPYLHFNGNCEEALKFYGQAIGGDFQIMMRFKDVPGQENCPEAFKEKICHSTFSYMGTPLFLVSDCPPHLTCTIGNNVDLALNFTDAKEMEEKFNKLSVGGKIEMPIQDMFWGAKFGMLVDKYGINWMFNMDNKKK